MVENCKQHRQKHLCVVRMYRPPKRHIVVYNITLNNSSESFSDSRKAFTYFFRSTLQKEMGRFIGYRERNASKHNVRYTKILTNSLKNLVFLSVFVSPVIRNSEYEILSCFRTTTTVAPSMTDNRNYLKSMKISPNQHTFTIGRTHSHHTTTLNGSAKTSG